MHRFAVLTVVMLGGCAASSAQDPKPVGMANPASVHCVKLGGRLEIRNGPGGQTGYCHLPDGRVVEEWKLFRETNPVRR
ncbi:putative hemolysin [Enterovirga rhinocerotis]|uniref:Hemolysin n=1 Tax=Enterovirga rhinocerotis TaxID=1339210 RepID=A0A4R7BVI7_9HYPH|nr:DUF333 domain-containing protein [Enterovirga rhinocerotis]TDR89868.1 hypothetical protein EV668_2704 [Enterovirga rhinocerotis]